MRVNSFFTGFFNNRMVVVSGLATVLLAIFFIAPSFTDHPDRALKTKQVNLIIRQIGHRLLLQAGDSGSRVMPVTGSKEGIFQLRFENEFRFNHDSLMLMAHALLPKSDYPAGYIVTVLDCKRGEIVYGFQINNNTPDILSCSGRTEPPGCYIIEFDFPDFYENGAKKIAAIDQPVESVKDNARVIIPNAQELKVTASNDEIARPNEKTKSTSFDSPLMNVVYGGMIGLLVLLGVTLLIRRSRKILKPQPVPDSNHSIISEAVPELPSLGKFLIDEKGQRLLLGNEIISLTDKEWKVLELLHKNFGELIPRETLMQEVWINEGVITGRSLDMFVSKLRKKLSGDPELRITNIHGKGYKLEIA